MRKSLAAAALVLAVIPVAGVGLGAVAGAATAGATAGARVPLAKVPAVPQGAVVGDALPATRPVSVDVALALPDPAAVGAFVTAVSTPASPQYRQYLAPGQFATRFGPSPTTVASVRSWLTSQGLTVGATSADDLLVPARGPAGVVAQAFGTTLSSVRLASGRTGYVDTVAPSLPAGLAGAVTGVVGLNDLARWHNNLQVDGIATATATATANAQAAGTTAAVTADATPDQAAPQACAAASAYAGPGPLTFTQLASIYDISGLYGQGRTGAGVSVALLELEPHSAKDIAAFEQCYGLSTAVTDITVDGGPGFVGQSGEAALDIEDVAAMAPNADILVYQGPNSTTSGAGSGPFETLDAMASGDRAQVVSSSWGVCEAMLTATAAGLENGIFQVMAAQGQTMLAAAGDEGSEGCFPTGGVTKDALAVDDPASQPDVTGVGGTALPGGSLANQAVWNDCLDEAPTCATTEPEAGASGGGISSVWAMPAWQSTAAAESAGTKNTYSSGLPCKNLTGYCREVPDVSADAAPDTGYIIYFDGSWGVVGGTSAASPLWAALMALTDQGCASTVGMANPALYRLGSDGSGAFTDVTVAGTNDLTGTNPGKYPTAAGYDMATGWGTPKGATLLADLQSAGGCPAVTGLGSTHGAQAGGGTLTISGTSLAGATAVHFGPSLEEPVLSSSASQVTVALPAAPYAQTVSVTVTTPNGTSAGVAQGQYTFGTPRNGLGYWLAAADGGIFSYGDAQFHGSMGGQPLNKPIVGLAATANGGGYWEVAADGGIFAFGDAQFYGSMGGKALNKPIVGLAVTPDGGGYWEVAADGGIFSFGDAQFYGSMGGQPLNQPIVGLAVTPDGKGYWEVAADGGLFAFGDAQFYGSMGGKPLNQPIVAMAPTRDGGGYWEVASDGGIFAFGDAQFYGSMGGQPLNQPIVAATATPDGSGYWEVASDGGIFSFGDAQFYGSTGALTLVAPVVGMANT